MSIRENHEAKLKRNGIILNRKFRQYLLPSVLTAIAISLDEFVDSLLVSNLLGTREMSMINVGVPIVYVITAIYLLFGLGGSTIYAICIGERRKDKAGLVFAAALAGAVIAGLLLMIWGTLMKDQLCMLLCHNGEMSQSISGYVQIILVTAPLMTGVLATASFFPVAGKPQLTTLINITSNVINLAGQYVLIRFFGMGVEGAAWGSFIGYGVCLIIVVIVIATGRVKLECSFSPVENIRAIPGIAAQGAANAANQIGFSVKFAFCNNLAIIYGGSTGLTVFALCMQTISIVSIGVQGIMDAMAPIAATLKGQNDRRGVSFVVKESLKYAEIVSLILVVIFELFPAQLMGLFNAKDPQLLAMGVPAIRIFALMFLVRSIYIIYMIYARVSGRRLYAFMISVCDGIIGTVLFGLIMTQLMGITGLWITFPLTSAVIAAGIVLVNRKLAAKSNGRFSPVLLLEKPEEVNLFDVSIDSNDKDISFLSREIEEFCLSKGIPSKLSRTAGLISEEMSVYTRIHGGREIPIDIMVSINKKELVVDFRSEGLPYNPLEENHDDVKENILLLRGFAKEIKYDYMLGMNSTRIILDVAPTGRP